MDDPCDEWETLKDMFGNWHVFLGRPSVPIGMMYWGDKLMGEVRLYFEETGHA